MLCKLCGKVSHTVYPLVHTSLLSSVHCNETLVLLNASGFCYTASCALTGPSGYPIFALCYGDPAVFYLKDWLLHMFQQIIDEVGQIIALVLGPGWELGWPTFQVPSSSLPGLAFRHCPG